MKISDKIMNLVIEQYPDISLKKSKYGVSNKSARCYGGKVYDSKLEANYRMHLDLLKLHTNKDLQVLDIQEQYEYPIIINGIIVFKYYADFRVHYNNRIEVIDCKGVRTSTYILKKKCVEAYYGIKIKEIVSGGFLCTVASTNLNTKHKKRKQ